MESAIRIENLDCGYGDKFRISDVSFEVPTGCFMAVIGPNGAGKTTLFRGISGMLKADLGKICIEGENMAELSH